MSQNGESYDDNFNGIRLLTVGRLRKEKGYNIIPDIVERLIHNGYEIKWYCIGDGNLKETLKNKINEKGLQESVILLGEKSNPYTYIKDCDIYVQPSIYEGYCISLSEAKIFNKPIVATNFLGAKEQLIDKKTGFIVNYNEEELFNAIKNLIDDKCLCKYFIENLTEQSYVNQDINKVFKELYI